LPPALAGAGHGTNPGAARNGEDAGLAGFDIAENMFYMFSAMLFWVRLSSRSGHGRPVLLGSNRRTQPQNCTTLTPTPGRISAISRIAVPPARTP
jgi:hypothetical protein